MEKDFLSILISELQNPNRIEDLKYFLNFKNLEKKFRTMIEYILDFIELQGVVPNLTTLGEKFKIYNWQGISLIPNEELHEKIELFMLKYNEYSIKNSIAKFSENKVITKDVIDMFLNNKFEEYQYNNDFKLEDIQARNKIAFSTCVDFIDKSANGIIDGTVTSIVGCDNGYKSMLALNIAYKALQNKKNVLYVSLGTSKEYTFLRFLSRHSCNNENTALEYPGLITSKINSNLYNTTVQDFKENLGNNLIIIDEEKFDLFTITVWNRILYSIQKCFEKSTGNGIDLIVIDDFTFIKLEDKKRKNITNTNLILNTYMSYFRNQCKNFLNMNSSISIILTVRATDFGIYNVNCNIGTYKMEYLYSEVQKLSDTIISIYSNQNLCNNQQVKVQLLKGVSDVCNFIDTNTPITMNADINYWVFGDVPFLNEEVRKKLEDCNAFEEILAQVSTKSSSCLGCKDIEDEKKLELGFATLQQGFTLEDKKIFDSYIN